MQYKRHAEVLARPEHYVSWYTDTDYACVLAGAMPRVVWIEAEVGRMASGRPYRRFLVNTLRSELAPA
jgi:hypothetical protein